MLRLFPLPPLPLPRNKKNVCFLPTTRHKVKRRKLKINAAVTKQRYAADQPRKILVITRAEITLMESFSVKQ